MKSLQGLTQDSGQDSRPHCNDQQHARSGLSASCDNPMECETYLPKPGPLDDAGSMFSRAERQMLVSIGMIGPAG